MRSDPVRRFLEADPEQAARLRRSFGEVASWPEGRRRELLAEIDDHDLELLGALAAELAGDGRG